MKQTTGAASRPKDTQDSNPDAWLRRLARYCWRHKRSMLLSLAGALAATLATAAIPLIFGLIVDDTILTHDAPVWACALVLIGAGLVNFAGVYTRRFTAGRLSLDVQYDLRADVFKALQRWTAPAGRAADRPGGQPVDQRRRPGAGPARLPADADRQRAAVRDLAGGDALAVARC